MKRNKACFYSLFFLVFLLLSGLEGRAQGRKIQKTYSWEYDVNKDVKFTFNNYDCNLVIHTWDRGKIEYQLSVDAVLKSEEDARRLDEYIENLEFSHSAGSAEFNNRFWQSRKNIMGKKTLDLKGERTIRYSDFNMSGELWIPKGTNLNLSSKYSSIEIEDLDGRVSFDLYNDKLFGGDVNNRLNLAAKYSTLELKMVKDVVADLYNTDVETEDLGNLEVRSKYSKFSAGNAGRIAIDSYSDKYYFSRTGDIRFTDKYSDLKAEVAGNLDLDCYSSTLIIDNVEDVEVKSKYGKFEIGKAGNFHISGSYSDNLKVRSLLTLNIDESKYGTYKLEQLTSSLLLKEGYSDKFFVTKTGTVFKGAKVNGKYILVEMDLDPSLNFKFKASVKYPKFEIDEDAMDVRRKIQDGSQLDMEAIRGTETEEMAEFDIRGYDLNLNFTYQ